MKYHVNEADYAHTNRVNKKMIQDTVEITTMSKIPHGGI